LLSVRASRARSLAEASAAAAASPVLPTERRTSPIWLVVSCVRCEALWILLAISPVAPCWFSIAVLIAAVVVLTLLMVLTIWRTAATALAVAFCISAPPSSVANHWREAVANAASRRSPRSVWPARHRHVAGTRP